MLTLTQALLMHLPIPASRLLLGINNTSNPHHKQDLARKLNHLWGMFEPDFKLRGEIIWREMTLHIKALGYQVPTQLKYYDEINDCISDLNMQPFLASQITSVISSCSPTFLAEIREWQRVWYISTFILCAMNALLKLMRKPKVSFFDDLLDAMVATAFTFPPPRGTLPAEQRPDDRDRIMCPYMCFDEPLMRNVISSLSDRQRNHVTTRLERVRKRFPPFPPAFSIWDTKPGHNLLVRRVLGQEKKKAPRLRLKIPECVLLPGARREHKYRLLEPSQAGH